MLFLRSLPAILAVLTLSAPAFAYVGPGAGLSLITAFGVLAAAILSSLAFLVLWPLRRARRRRQLERQQGAASRSADSDDEGEIIEGELLPPR